MGKRYLVLALMLLAILIMLVVLGPRLSSFVTTGVLDGQTLPFETIDQGSSIRSYDKMEQLPSIYVIAKVQEVDAFAQNVIGVDPQVNDQRARVAEQLRHLDYDRFFAILVIREITGGNRSLTVQQVIRQGTQVRVGAKYLDPWPMQGQPDVVAEPYQLIAVSKEGTWGQAIDFELFVGGQVVARTDHVIP
jgi:hypothetical protein